MKILSWEKDQKDIKEIFAARRSMEIEADVMNSVSEIVTAVKKEGEKAVKTYTEQFDGVKLDDLKVNTQEIKEARKKVSDDFLSSLQKSISKVKDFHKRQLKNSWFNSEAGGLVGQKITPLQRIGAYVPGGRFPYPSSVVMTVVPAVAAGVQEIVVTTPPDETGKVNPHILTAAIEAGADEIYKVGGAQAVAALAYGTDNIESVDKIVGPGNIYVTAAKKIVFGTVDIDMLAGPSEILILADETADPDYAAADLLSQAEHDPRAVSVLVTTSSKLAKDVTAALQKQLSELENNQTAADSMKENGMIITVPDINQGIDLVNDFAPEHFELVVNEPFAYLGLIKNAGAIFIGEKASEPMGDYIAGPNHVLPTGGTGRFSSPLNTDDFIKKSSIIYYNKHGFAQDGPDARRLAELEGLEAHARAVAIRQENEK